MDKDKQIEKLKKELETMKLDRDSSMFMYKDFLSTSIERGKAIDVLMPIVKSEELNEILAELYDLRKSKKELEDKLQYFRSKKGRKFMNRVDKVGICEALQELGEFKEEK